MDKLGTKTIYNLLKRHNQCTICQNKKKIQTFWNEISKRVGSDGHQRTFLSKRFTKQTIFYSCYIDDCSIKVVSKWCNRRNSAKSTTVGSQRMDWTPR